jgi:uncharacterized protein YbaA (DUF1428 family)
MTYYEGFVAAVPKANKDAYRKHAADAAPIFREFGVTRHVEAWGDDLPEGKLTDFRMAVQAKEDEDVVFAWFEYPDKATRDSANEKMMSDPRMKNMGESMPFDGKRMIYGGFEPVVEEGSERGNYVDGFVVPVPNDKLDAYKQLARKAAGIFREHGALRDVEAIASDVPRGEVTDFYRAVKSEDGETVFFSFLEWRDKAARDEGWKKIMEDERMKPEGDMPFAGPRMFWGGFEPIFDSAKSEPAQAAAPAGQPA